MSSDPRRSRRIALVLPIADASLTIPTKGLLREFSLQTDVSVVPLFEPPRRPELLERTSKSAFHTGQSVDA